MRDPFASAYLWHTDLHPALPLMYPLHKFLAVRASLGDGIAVLVAAMMPSKAAHPHFLDTNLLMRSPR